MTGGMHYTPSYTNVSKFFQFSTYIFSADITPEMLKLCRVTKVKVFFQVLVYVLNLTYLNFRRLFWRKVYWQNPQNTILDSKHRDQFIPRLRQSSFHRSMRVGVLIHWKTSHNIKIGLYEIFSLFDNMFMTVNVQIELRSRMVLYRLPRNSVLLFLYLFPFLI